MTDFALDDPIAVLLAAVRACKANQIDALAYGGLALAVYGNPRETRDADLAVSTASVDDLGRALASTNLTTTVAFDGVRFGGLSISRLTLLGGGKLNMIDLVVPRSPRFAGLLMARPMIGPLRGEQIAVVAPEDFVLLKVLSTRAKDLEDARSVMTLLADDLDRDLLADEATRLAVEIPDHDVAGRFAAVTAP